MLERQIFSRLTVPIKPNFWVHTNHSRKQRAVWVCKQLPWVPHTCLKPQNNQQGLTYIKPKLIFCPAAIWVIHVTKLGFIERFRKRSQTFKMPEIAWGMHLAQAVCQSSHVLVILGLAFKTTTYGAPICASLMGGWGRSGDRPLPPNLDPLCWLCLL